MRVGIVGCGNIGAQWDYASNGQRHSLSHAGAFSRQPRADLRGLCDIDPVRARGAAERWGGEAFADVGVMIERIRPDLLVIAGPTAERADCINTALAQGVRFFVIEKPLAHDLDAARTIARNLDRAGARGLVNFSRRWDPAMARLRQSLSQGDFGKVRRILGIYGKGTANNGSHMIDLAGFLLDAAPRRARALGSPLDARESDWSDGQDKALDAQVIYRDALGADTQLTMAGTDQRDLTVFELRLFLESAVIEIGLGGRRIETASAAPDPVYPGYAIPSIRRRMAPGLFRSMDRMAQDAIAMVDGGRLRSPCFAEQALTTAATVDAIIASQAGSGHWIDIDGQEN